MLFRDLRRKIGIFHVQGRNKVIYAGATLFLSCTNAMQCQLIYGVDGWSGFITGNSASFYKDIDEVILWEYIRAILKEQFSFIDIGDSSIEW